MPTIAWKTSPKGRPSDPMVVMAGRLVLKRWRDVPGFFRAAFQLRRAVMDSGTAAGISLRAEPLARRFWVLSAWSNELELRAFVKGEAHRTVMARYRDRMSETHFTTTLTATGQAYPPTWDEAMKQLATPATDDQEAETRPLRV